jgi:hypothetical protein
MRERIVCRENSANLYLKYQLLQKPMQAFSPFLLLNAYSVRSKIFPVCLFFKMSFLAP